MVVFCGKVPEAGRPGKSFCEKCFPQIPMGVQTGSVGNKFQYVHSRQRPGGVGCNPLARPQRGPPIVGSVRMHRPFQRAPRTGSISTLSVRLTLLSASIPCGGRVCCQPPEACPGGRIPCPPPSGCIRPNFSIKAVEGTGRNPGRPHPRPCWENLGNIFF